MPRLGRLRALGGTAAALTALACVSLVVMNGVPRATELLNDLGSRDAAFRAVGDPGCLGRSCELSDRSSRRALDSFFNTFLGGAHAGHAPRYVGNAPAERKLSTRQADDDLASYYDSLPGTRTRAVKRRARPGHHLAMYGGKDASHDLNSFYDALRSSKRAGIIAVEEHAEDRARARLVAARETEENAIKRMNAAQKGSEAQARRDQRRYRHESEGQLERQARGHTMQAVPSVTRSARSARAAQGQYFKALAAQANKAKAATMSQKPVPQARSSAERAPLSAARARAQEGVYFAKLSNGVGKTHRVLSAEADVHRGLQGDGLTRAAAMREQDRYWVKLAKGAALTAPVRQDVAREAAGKAHREISSEAARRQLADYVPS